MGQLERMSNFIHVVEAGGISKAAEQSGLAKSAVSRQLSELEHSLGIQLLTRTTRSSSLTDAGREYYQRARAIVEEVDNLNEHTQGSRSDLTGVLKISAPLSFGLLHLNDVIDEFAQAHPQLQFQLDFSDRQLDLVSEGYELALRIGPMPDSSLQARRLCEIRQLLCASPNYLQQHGTPKHPRDLSQHSFLQYGLLTQTNLTLRDHSNQLWPLSLNGRFRADNGDFLRDLAVKGHGIALLPSFLIYQQLAKGELVPVLADYSLPSIQAYAVYPQTRFLSQRCRLLIEFLAQRFGGTPYWDAELPK